MTLTEITTAALVKRGMQAQHAKEFAEELFIGFSKEVVEMYARQKWKEGCEAQRRECEKVHLLKQYSRLEMAQAIRVEIKNAPEPAFL